MRIMSSCPGTLFFLRKLCYNTSMVLFTYNQHWEKTDGSWISGNWRSARPPSLRRLEETARCVSIIWVWESYPGWRSSQSNTRSMETRWRYASTAIAHFHLLEKNWMSPYIYIPVSPALRFQSVITREGIDHCDGWKGQSFSERRRQGIGSVDRRHYRNADG